MLIEIPDHLYQMVNEIIENSRFLQLPIDEQVQVAVRDALKKGIFTQEQALGILGKVER